MISASDHEQTFSWPQVSARRLARHGLADPLPDPVAAVAAMGGAHAQVLSAAEISIGLRCSSVTRLDVAEALWSQRSLVKTYGPRGTVHLLPANELATWMAALAAVPVPGNGPLTPAQTDDVVEAIGAVLTDAELTVDELDAAVLARSGSWAADPVIPAFGGFWPRWRAAITAAAYRGVLCFAPNRGRLATYTHPGRWLAGPTTAAPRPVDSGPALSTVVERFLHGYGPASPAHFAQWLAAPRRWAEELFASLGERLVPVAVDGATGWVSAGDAEPPQEPPRGVRLLPYFDPYVVGGHPRERLFPGTAASRALTRGQAGTVPVLLVDGVVGGVWALRRQGRVLEVTVQPFGRLSTGQQREVRDQVDRVAQILAGRPSLTFGTVSTGRHL